MKRNIERTGFFGHHRRKILSGVGRPARTIYPNRSYGADVVEICPCWLPVDGALVQAAVLPCTQHNYTLIKEKIKFSSYVRKFRMQQFQSHI
jgi:hypothetical protein